MIDFTLISRRRAMKKTVLFSLAFLAVAAVPAHAQFFRRPIVQTVLHSPVVHALAETGVSYFSPTAGALLHDVNRNLESRSVEPAKIYVDSAVSKNLDATRENLRDAENFMKDLRKKYD